MQGKWPDQTLKRHSDAWNGDSRPHLAPVLPVSSENAYHSQQFKVHPGNPCLTDLRIPLNDDRP
jgi:hypothetical protein